MKLCYAEAVSQSTLSEFMHGINLGLQPNKIIIIKKEKGRLDGSFVVFYRRHCFFFFFNKH